MPDQYDQLISNPKVAKLLGVGPRTIFRWTTLPELNFPAPCKVNGRRYFSSAEIEAWKLSRKAGVELASPAAPLPGIVAPIRTGSRKAAAFEAIREKAESV